MSLLLCVQERRAEMADMGTLRSDDRLPGDDSRGPHRHMRVNGLSQVLLWWRGPLCYHCSLRALCSAHRGFADRALKSGEECHVGQDGGS